MTKADERFQEGRNKRLGAEVNKQMHNLPVQYSCIYRRTEQASQYKRGWHSVSQIDIDVAIKLATGTEQFLSTIIKGTNP